MQKSNVFKQLSSYIQWWGRCQKHARHHWLYYSLTTCLLEAGPSHFTDTALSKASLLSFSSAWLLLLLYVSARPPKYSTGDIHIPITSLCTHQSIWAGNTSFALAQENTHLLKSQRGIVFKNVRIPNASLFIHLQLQLTLQHPALTEIH